MLTFENITIDIAQFKWLGVKTWHPLLIDISINVQPGEMVALVGSSGEGKSIFLQNSLGLLPNNMRSMGHITINGRTITDKQKSQLRGNTICYVPQGVNALNPLLRIGPQLKRTTKLNGVQKYSHDVLHILQQFELQQSIVNCYPRQLSGGMAKRVLACNAALAEAQYILADEITAWLDNVHAMQLLTYLKKLCKQGRGTLWVTHDLAMAAKFADRIAILHNGRLEEIVTPSQLKFRQASKWSLCLWDALPEHKFIS
ncbi:ATP-binding cassette domain-containing protein [Orbus sturtevantii]|uniref:ATP-binding cassette domain-containing protein n=1 Tax=Orbus sturtevantii TaxID=3074109 RepID=UPI00370DAA7C